eukprot:TRINITY_DN1289_c0_g1_i1.p1 TRINITY_DN1289_c0_g1~~TRINITY_DN1289_c0_g1_i1.p1  ORF type:complete len:496 (+),score=119.62 TRINITY_DN1289_c0_g1_i1:80-1567(+)
MGLSSNMRDLSRRAFFVLFLCVLTTPFLTTAFTPIEDVEELVARVDLSSVPNALDKLLKDGYDVDHHPHDEGTEAEVYGSAQDMQRLAEEGFSFRMVESESKAAHTRAMQENEEVKRSLEAAMGSPLLEPSRYYNYQDLTNFLDDVTTNRCPNITKKFSIGQTLNNRQIWGIEISDNAGVNEPLEPEFKLIGNIHGDEVVGRMILIYYIDYLCTNYGKTDDKGTRVTNIIDNTHIYIIPSINPDGFERGTRSNSRGIDLNRDFPDQFSSNQNTPNGRQLETQAMMAWTASRHFVLSASYHGGAVVANYPWDGNANYQSGRYSACPDDRVYKELASTYANTHSWMSRSNEFTNGITNGAEWYVLYGGMQDWNYLWYACLELTLEVSDIKYPSASSLMTYWNENLEAMLVYTEIPNKMGVRGTVTDASGKPLAATVQVDSLRAAITDPEHGDYYKIIPAGTYQITASATGYKSTTKTLNIPLDQSSQQVVNFVLQKN